MDLCEKLVISRQGQGSVDAYLEYHSIVGDDDGGKLFSPAEYEAYKARMLPIRRANRLYVSWGLSSGHVDCKLVGPETPCFCGHRYRQHQTDFEHVPRGADVDVRCKQQGCACVQYTYVPRVGGGMPPRCSCKHLSAEHTPRAPFACTKACGCAGYRSGITCDCGSPFSDHRTLVETRAERMARGQPVAIPGKGDLIQAMGGLTHFSSLANGRARQEAAAAVGMDPQSLLLDAESATQAGPGPGVVRRAKLTEEEEMAFYEKRYQERLKAERDAKRTDAAARRPPARALPPPSSSRTASTSTAPPTSTRAPAPAPMHASSSSSSGHRASLSRPVSSTAVVASSASRGQIAGVGASVRGGTSTATATATATASVPTTSTSSAAATTTRGAAAGVVARGGAGTTSTTRAAAASRTPAPSTTAGKGGSYAASSGKGASVGGSGSGIGGKGPVGTRAPR